MRLRAYAELWPYALACRGVLTILRLSVDGVSQVSRRYLTLTKLSRAINESWVSSLGHILCITFEVGTGYIEVDWSLSMYTLTCQLKGLKDDIRLEHTIYRNPVITLNYKIWWPPGKILGFRGVFVIQVSLYLAYDCMFCFYISDIL